MEARLLKTYAPLATSMLHTGTGFAQPAQELPERVNMDDPALVAMTDFERVSAVLIRPNDSIDEANQRMIQRGVRLLLVVDTQRDVAGLITANDILGEKPLQFITERGGGRHDIEVRDIMTPQSRLEVLELRDVQHARVGQIIATLKEAGRQHALIVDRDSAGRQRVRGMFSLTQIARQLGIPIQPNEIARTFSEIEAMLTH
jgi:CBS domain containing-hemolysin-like protein